MAGGSLRLVLIGLAFVLGRAGSSPPIGYSYHPLDRLTQVTYDDGTVESYSYDAAGNRLSRVVSVDPDADGVRFAGGANVCRGGQSSGCEDNCTAVANPDQADFDGDASGNACDTD